jgi:hypothetical protein
MALPHLVSRPTNARRGPTTELSGPVTLRSTSTGAVQSIGALYFREYRRPTRGNSGAIPLWRHCEAKQDTGPISLGARS